MRGIAILISSLLLSGCTAGSGAVDSGPRTQERVIRVSYIRHNLVLEAGSSAGKLIPDYYYLLSESWCQKHGRTPKEPFVRTFKTPFAGANLPDEVLQDLMDTLMDLGFDQLPHRNPDEIDLTALAGLAGERDPQRLRAQRMLSVESGDYRRTVYFPDLLAPDLRTPADLELVKIFNACEVAFRERSQGRCVRISSEPFR